MCSSDLPVVLSVVEKINEPRYPSFKGIMAAKKKPLQQRSQQLEKQLATLESERTAIESQLASDSFYSGNDRDAVEKAIRASAELRRRINGVEEQWLAVQAELEAISAEG